jgi:uncharacterized protein with PIN domain
MKFILTKELGRLAKWLRIFGFDTIYYNNLNSSTLLLTALQENRIIVTRTAKMGVHLGIRTVIIESDFLHEQLQQLFRELNIAPDVSQTFSRCVLCNETLLPIDKEQVKTKVPEFVYQTQDSFMSCSACKRIYWQGTHWGNVKQILKNVYS